MRGGELRPRVGNSPYLQEIRAEEEPDAGIVRCRRHLLVHPGERVILHVGLELLVARVLTLYLCGKLDELFMNLLRSQAPIPAHGNRLFKIIKIRRTPPGCCVSPLMISVAAMMPGTLTK